VATADWLGDVLTHIDGGPTERRGAGCFFAVEPGDGSFAEDFWGVLKESLIIDNVCNCNYMIYRCTFYSSHHPAIHKFHRIVIQIIYSNQTKMRIQWTIGPFPLVGI